MRVFGREIDVMGPFGRPERCGDSADFRVQGEDPVVARLQDTSLWRIDRAVSVDAVLPEAEDSAALNDRSAVEHCVQSIDDHLMLLILR